MIAKATGHEQLLSGLLSRILSVEIKSWNEERKANHSSRRVSMQLRRAT